MAERQGEIVGWISAYLPPAEPNSIFVWQVAVDASARGLGLGRQMLDELMSRRAAWGITTLTTTITETNDASWALFRSFARDYGAEIQQRPMFERDVHFAGAHDTEFLVSITPLAAHFKISAKEIQ